MLTVTTRHAVDPDTAAIMDTDALRANFLIADLFVAGQINLCYTHYDRMIVGAAVPDGKSLTLDHVAEAGTATILERREMAVVNVGDTGKVSARDDYTLDRGDVLYLGRGSGPVTFSGKGRFYILSAPAHTDYPSRLITLAEANKVELGATDTANKRTINQFVHPLVMESCQLVCGYTQFAPGSVWNTMPCHTHERRMEAYLYFDMADDTRMFHLMGQPDETRHIVMKNEQAVVSPPWSIHAGCGTGGYSFVWAMAGDNVDYTDMDMIAMEDLR